MLIGVECGDCLKNLFDELRCADCADYVVNLLNKMKHINSFSVNHFAGTFV